MFKLKRFDLILIFLFLSLSTVSGWWGYRLYMGNFSTNSKPVGRLLMSQNDVFKKGEEEFFYTGVSTGKDVFENDQITTGIDSQADITFGKSKSKLTLKELSHVVLRFKDKSFALDIKSGKVEATLSGKESVLIDGKKLSAVGGDSAKILYIKNQDGTQLKVLEGEVNFTENNQLHSMKASLPGSTRQSTIQIEEPLPESYVSNAQGRVNFRWNDSKNTPKYRLKIFEKNKLINAVTLKEKEATLELPHEGQFDWFVEDLQTPDNTTPIANFQLANKPFFNLVTAKSSESYILKGDTTQQNVKLAWEQAQPGTSTLVLEKMGADGKYELVQEVPQKSELQGSFSVPLPAGSYRWTLKAGANQSEAGLFGIVEESLPVLNPPVISDIKQEFSEKIRKEGVIVNWAPIPEALSYEVEFKSNILQVTENGTYLPLKTAGEANYRARTLNKKKIAGPWSDFKRITLLKPKTLPLAVKPPPPPPAPTPPPPPVETKATPEVSWNGIEIPKIIQPDSATDIISHGEMTQVNIVVASKTCNDYEVEIDESSKFSNPTILKLDNGKGTVSLSKGSYLIHARCWKNGDMGSWSLVRKFNIQ